MKKPLVFISYSHKDLSWVREFAQALKKFEVNVWLDEWQIQAGESIVEALEMGLRESDAIIAIVSKYNVDSPNIYFELGVALGLGKKLIPIIEEGLEPSLIPFDLRTRRFLTRGSPSDVAKQVAQSVVIDSNE